jgi:O-antigen/teichoic acid export membrane protein
VSARPDWKLKVVKESGIGLSGSLVGTVLNYVLLLIVTRTLEPSEYGTFALAQSVTTIALILALFGTPRALDRFIPLYNASGEFGKTRTLISRTFRVIMSAGAAFAVALVLAAGFIAGLMSDVAALTPVLRAMALGIPLLVYIELVASSFVGFKELRYQAYMQQLALPAVRIALVALAFAMGYRLAGWVAVYLVSLVPVSLLALAFFRHRISPMLSAHDAAPLSLGSVASYSWPLTVNSIVLVFFGQVGVLFLGRYSSLADAGVFRVYVYAVMVMVMVRASFTRIFKPIASEMISTGDHAELGCAYSRVGKWLFALNAGLFLVIAIFGSRALGILLGENYLVVPAALAVLAAGRLAVSSLGPLGMTLEAFGHTKLSMANALLMVGVNVALCAVLVPRYGILGAAIAASAAGAAGALAGLIEVYALHRLHPVSPEFLKCAGVAIVVGLLARWQLGKLPALGLAGVISLAAATLVLYGLGLLVSGGLDAVDRGLLAGARDRVLRRSSDCGRRGNGLTDRSEEK